MSDMEQNLITSKNFFICKYNQTGFCKFSENWKNKHVDEACENLNDCKLFGCIKTHPKICNKFAKIKKWRFNEDCAYQDSEIVKPNKQNEINEVMANIISKHSKDIYILHEKMNKLKLLILNMNLNNLHKTSKTSQKGKKKLKLVKIMVQKMTQ